MSKRTKTNNTIPAANPIHKINFNRKIKQLANSFILFSLLALLPEAESITCKKSPIAIFPYSTL